MTPNETALSLDDTIRAEGQPLGRFSFSYHDSPGSTDPQLSRPGGSWDWLPNPDGTHDGYIWRLGFYTLPHQEQAS